MRKAALIELNYEERQRLQKLAKGRSSKGHEALRARAILLAAEGMTNLQISDEVGLHYNAIAKTRARFVQERLDALQDRPRSGRKPTIAPEVKGRILGGVLHVMLSGDPGQRLPARRDVFHSRSLRPAHRQARHWGPGSGR